MAQKTLQETADHLLKSRVPTRGRPKMWKNYSRNERLVAIAYDIIQALLAGVYEPTQHRYVDAQAIMAQGGKRSLQEVLTNDELKDCGVCALGAAFLSLVRFENHKMCDEPVTLQAGTNDRARLTTLLGAPMFYRIEMAYECEVSLVSMREIPPGQARKIIARFTGLTREERMLSIWMNVIKHNGEFKP